MFGFEKKKFRHMDLRDLNFNFDVYTRSYEKCLGPKKGRMSGVAETHRARQL